MSDLPRIVFLDRAAFSVAVQPRRIEVACEWIDHNDTPPELVRERLQGATAVITVNVPLGPADLEGLDTLKFISACSSGLNHVDLDCCRAHGIEVEGVAGYASQTVAEHAMALLLAVKRGLAGYVRDMDAGEWAKSGRRSLPIHPVGDLHGLRLGLVGSGAIGETLARIASGFGMQIMRAGRKGASEVQPGRTPFDEVIATADVISLHCPLTPETAGLIGEIEFAAMTRRPVIINTARGALIDEAALVRALADDRIAGAGLDVVSSEPIAIDNPLNQLIGDPRFILTPHVGWSGDHAQQALYDGGIDNVLAFLARQGYPWPHCDHSWCPACGD